MFNREARVKLYLMLACDKINILFIDYGLPDVTKIIENVLVFIFFHSRENDVIS